MGLGWAVMYKATTDIKDADCGYSSYSSTVRAAPQRLPLMVSKSF